MFTTRKNLKEAGAFAVLAGFLAGGYKLAESAAERQLGSIELAIPTDALHTRHQLVNLFKQLEDLVLDDYYRLYNKAVVAADRVVYRYLQAKDTPSEEDCTYAYFEKQYCCEMILKIFKKMKNQGQVDQAANLMIIFEDIKPELDELQEELVTVAIANGSIVFRKKPKKKKTTQ